MMRVKVRDATWDDALLSAQTGEFLGVNGHFAGNFDQINAAYAYLRGYTSSTKFLEDIYVSIMDTAIDRDHLEFKQGVDTPGGPKYEESSFIQGYSAKLGTDFVEDDDDDVRNYDVTKGTCFGKLSLSNLMGCDENQLQGSHVAGIIGARADGVNPTMQGLAYRSKMKPIDISGDITEAQRIAAIRQASGMTTRYIHNRQRRRVTERKVIGQNPDGTDKYGFAVVNNADTTPRYVDEEDDIEGEIWDITDTTKELVQLTVMNNGWDDSGVGSYIDGDGNEFYYQAARAVATITTAERTAWKDAVADTDDGNTVVVFAQGDYGYNGENGMIKLYSDDTLATRATEDSMPKEVAWERVDSENRNLGSSHARLPLEVTELAGKWLSVVAVGVDNRIWQHSNGCGDAMAWCLSAPGVGIYAPNPGASAVFYNPVTTGTGPPDGAYREASGTAVAAAHVTGAIAVLAAIHPTMTPTELVALVLDTATDIGNVGDDTIYGQGLLNLGAALESQGTMTITSAGRNPLPGITIDNSGITLPTSFGGALDGFTVGFIDDYKRAYIGKS